MRLAEPRGGGAVPSDGDMSGATVQTRVVSGRLTLAPHSGAVLLG